MENGQKIIGIIVEMIREKADPMRMAERYLHDILEKSFIDEADVAALALLLLRVSRGKKCGSDCCERGGRQDQESSSVATEAFMNSSGDVPEGNYQASSCEDIGRRSFHEDPCDRDDWNDPVALSHL